MPIAYRLAFAMLRKRVDAEDVVQEAAMKAWQKRGTFRAGAEPRPWFLAIVANECRMVYRRRLRSSIEPLDPEQAASPAGGPGIEEVDQLRRALARLGREDRLVLSLRFYLDLSNEEVGHTLGISTAASRVRVHRAIQRLRPKIEVTL